MKFGARLKKSLNIKFHSMLIYDEIYIKAKVREFNVVIKTNFLGESAKGKYALHLHCLHNY